MSQLGLASGTAGSKFHFSVLSVWASFSREFLLSMFSKHEIATGGSRPPVFPVLRPVGKTEFSGLGAVKEETQA